MNTLEIDTLLKKHPHSRPVFKGVYARNILPRQLNVPSALVGNTDPDHRMGHHQALRKSRGSDDHCTEICVIAS